MRVFGLLGYPLDHSWSPAYFSQKFALENNTEDSYKLFPLKNLQAFGSLISQTDQLSGLNVTLPYKIEIMSLLDELDEVAYKTGSVNTVEIKRVNNKILTKGYNTDILGFELSLLPYLKPEHYKALLLGKGGGSKAVQYVLKKHGLDFSLVSRKPETDEDLAFSMLKDIDLSQYQIIINTTPVGQYPDMGNPLSSEVLKKISNKHLLFDLIYNPLETDFLRAGKEVGAICVNGMEMLIQQAEASWKIWNRK